MDPNPKSGGWMWLNRNPGFNLTSSLKKETKIYTLYICYQMLYEYLTVINESFTTTKNMP